MNRAVPAGRGMSASNSARASLGRSVSSTQTMVSGSLDMVLVVYPSRRASNTYVAVSRRVKHVKGPRSSEQGRPRCHASASHEEA